MKMSEIIGRVSSAFWRIFDPPKVEITINHAPSVPNVKMRRVAGSNTIRVDIDFDERNSRPIDVVIAERVAAGMASASSRAALTAGVEGRGGLGAYRD